MKLYVDANAVYDGDGSREKPFMRIQEAADIASAGDEVLVMPGIYRERVDPKNGGTAVQRIVYRSIVPKAAVITGAELLTGWQCVGGTVWTARVSNTIFGGRNPYTTRVSGDWFFDSLYAHTGDVFLNGKSLYEAAALEDVYEPKIAKESWEPERSLYVWYAKQDGEETLFYVNFRDKDPNRETVEFSVRPCCFAPSKEGIGYITLAGFTVCMAATQWAPPTAFQEGMIAPHWSRGWIIEDCEIFESKCSGISLGKYYQEKNDNKWLRFKYKDGTQTQRECVCLAATEGWSKETVGSHIIRRCDIHDCGQTGIVGHMGGVFSVIEDCHIHNICTKQNIAGAETGGIKLHAAIDVVIRRCHIHHCMRGLWLDWQAQGTRVTQNLFHDNALPCVNDQQESLSLAEEHGLGEDIFLEVSHGPTLIDNNLLLSDRSLKLPSQGYAVVHNLIAGSLVAIGRGTENGSLTLPSPRYTPYHVPHSTVIAGFMTFLHGDARFYSNIFVQPPVRRAFKDMMEKSRDDVWDDCNVWAGTFCFDDYPTFEEWDSMFEGYCGMGSARSDRYYRHLPVWMEGNVYFNGAKPWKKERGCCCDTAHEVCISLAETPEGFVLRTNLFELLPGISVPITDTTRLGIAFEPEQRFEQPDGTDIALDTDIIGAKRSEKTIPGPFSEVSLGSAQKELVCFKGIGERNIGRFIIS